MKIQHIAHEYLKYFTVTRNEDGVKIADFHEIEAPQALRNLVYGVTTHGLLGRKDYKKAYQSLWLISRASDVEIQGVLAEIKPKDELIFMRIVDALNKVSDDLHRAGLGYRPRLRI